MFNFTQEEREIYQRDQKNHPNCGYAVSTTKRCGERNGELVCETMRQLQRLCAGNNPVTISSEKKQYHGNDSVDDGPDPLKSFMKEDGIDRFFDPFSLFEESLKSFGTEIFRNRSFEHPNYPTSPHQKSMPDHFDRGQNRDRGLNGKVVQDSVEEI